MNERLTLLRNQLRMSQEELGAKIGLTRFTISNYESGRRKITDRVISDLCREFNINEHWFRTGEGNMFQDSDKSILGELTTKFHLDNLDIKILESYLKLPSEQRHWFRTGEGNMFQDSDKSILGELTTKFHLDNLDIKILESYLKLPSEQRAVIKHFIAGIAAESDKSILGELTTKFHLDNLDIKILESYLKLPSEQRAVIKHFIAGIAAEPVADPIQLELDAYRNELEAEHEAQTSSVFDECAEDSKMA